jgi:transposase
MNKVHKKFKKLGKIFGVDSTGMELDNASMHYCKRIDREKPIKGFVNLNAITDLENKCFVAVKIRKRRRHDTVDFPSIFNKVKFHDFDTLVADKGYDSERNHEYIHKAGKISLISLKNKDLPLRRTRGEHRKIVKRHFDDKKYGKREICESIFSSLKRKYGSKLKARKFSTQKIELLFKLLTYNIEKVIRSFIEMIYRRRVFLQSPTNQKVYIIVFICQ